MLELRSVSAGKRNRVFSDVSMTLAPGTVTGLLGKNGCGKTTLLRAVCGDIPYRGGILLNGEPLSGKSVRKRARLVTMMPQEPPAAAALTAEEYALFGCYSSDGVFGTPRTIQAQRERVLSRAREFGITFLLGRMLSGMSVGERQLVSLLRVAVQDTEVLLFDEPAAALDPDRTEILYDYLRRCAGQGKTVLCVLHDPAAALSVCDTLYTIHDGRLSRPFACSGAEPEEAHRFFSECFPGICLGRDAGTGAWYSFRAGNGIPYFKG